MIVRKRINNLNDRGRVLTLGVFDGVHIGHAAIFRKVISQARKLKVPASVMTFHDHPHGTLEPAKRPPRLANTAQCLTRMRALGIQEVFLVRFTHAFADIPAEAFVRQVLVGRLRVRHIVIGRDFVFGKGGNGNAEQLREWGKQYGFGVTLVNPVRRSGEVVSSSSLRRMVGHGDMARVLRWLGWPYTLHGRVMHGDGRGSKIGLPTANIKTLHEIVPVPATYAVAVRLGGKILPALCHIGRRPTFHRWGPQTIEVHIPGWKGQLYGRQLCVGFLAQLRGETAFRDAGALLAQVRQDWDRARKLWTKHRLDPKIIRQIA